MIQAYTYDLFNTLVKMNKTLDEAPYRSIIKNLNISQKEMRGIRDFIMTTNVSPRRLTRIIEQKYQISIDTEMFLRNIEQEIDQASLFPDTIEHLEMIKSHGLKTGLISNLATPYKQLVYDLGLEKYFDTITFSCDIGLQKPQQEIYFKTLQELQVNPQNTIMIGDSERNDYIAPRKLGIQAYHLQRDYINNQNKNIHFLPTSLI